MTDAEFEDLEKEVKHLMKLCKYRRKGKAYDWEIAHQADVVEEIVGRLGLE